MPQEAVIARLRSQAASVARQDCGKGCARQSSKKVWFCEF